MSRGPWKRDKFTGLTGNQLGFSGLLDPEKELPERYSDCDIFNITSMAAVLGVTAVYFRDTMLPNSLSLFHTHCESIVDSRGHNIGTLYAANTTSLSCAKAHWRQLEWGCRSR